MCVYYMGTSAWPWPWAVGGARAGTETLRPCLVPTSHRSETLRPLLAGLGLEEDMASYADGFGITPPRIQPWTL